jgi:hypothetical protein
MDPRTLRRLIKAAAALTVREKVIPPITLEELRRMAGKLLEEKPEFREFSNWAILLLNNALWSKVVAGIPNRRKLLLLPQCLKQAENCPARIDELGLMCEGCGLCAIQEIQQYADDLGLMCLVAEGSTMVAQLIEDGEVDAVIGVSCFEALEKAFTHMINHAVPGLALPLFQAGCRNTTTDIPLLKTLLSRPSSRPFSPQPLKPLLETVKSWFDEATLTAVLGSVRDETERIAREFLLSEGKRYRPFLCVAIAQSLGAPSMKDEDLMKSAIAVECFHKASLIHDDIEDEDSLRNGLPTLHARHGIPLALNSGDFLLGEGYRLISELSLGAAGKTAMLRIAAGAHLELCRGQGAELLCRHQGLTPSRAEVLRIFEQKTAPAFHVAFQFGAILRKASASVRDVLDSFSRHLGIAYQINDDLQDHSGEGPEECTQPSIINAIMTEAGVTRQEATRQARELRETFRQRALLALRPLKHFPLKRLLFQVTHAILKDPE